MSDRITDMLNEEMKRPDFSPVQAFAGVMMGLLCLMRTAEALNPPPEFVIAKEAVAVCLFSMMDAEHGPPPGAA